jgi:2-isopropylmalate synthase
MDRLFKLDHWRVVSSDDKTGEVKCLAVVKILVKGNEAYEAADGVGPVDALYNALCKALKSFYPEIDELALVDYIVHAESSNKGTAAEVKVIIEMRQKDRSYIAESSSTNILVASWDALVEAMTILLSD